MRVDGGKGITSRGSSDWYGWLYMTRKFEQEQGKSYLNYKMYHKEIEPLKANADEDEIFDWCGEVQISKWAIKSDDAHLKQAAMYSNQEENLDHLAHAAESHKEGMFEMPKHAHH